MTDIKERLRELHRKVNDPRSGFVVGGLAGQAADHIEELEALVAARTRQYDAMIELDVKHRKRIEELEAEVDLLRVEITELKPFKECFLETGRAVAAERGRLIAAMENEETIIRCENAIANSHVDLTTQGYKPLVLAMLKPLTAALKGDGG